MSDSNSISEVVKSIPELIEAVLTVIQTPMGFLSTLIVLLWLIFNRDFSHVFNLLERKENKRLEKLELYISNENLSDPKCLEIVKEQRDSHYFNVATKIYAERKMRDALINLYNSTSHNITWTSIRRAMPYLEVNQYEEIQVRQKKWHEKVGFYYNWLVFIFSMLTGFGSIIYLSSSSGLSFIDILKVLAFMIFFVFFALYVLAQNFSHYSSNKISKEIYSEIPQSLDSNET